MDKERYYIAYGSNLNMEQMKTRCPTAKFVTTAWIDGYRLLFKGSKTGNYLTIEPSKDKGIRVPVVVYSVTESDERALDKYEGYPHFYFKKLFLFPFKGKKNVAFAYIMDPSRKIGIPSNSYIATCREGYRDYKLPNKYLDEAIRYTQEHAYKYSGEQERLWYEW